MTFSYIICKTRSEETWERNKMKVEIQIMHDKII